jgi:hypothetical protein
LFTGAKTYLTSQKKAGYGLIRRNLPNRAFYDNLADGVARSAAVSPLILARYRPKRIIDIGCGDGAWLAAFGRDPVVERTLGIDGSGAIDSLAIDGSSFRADLEDLVRSGGSALGRF